MLASPPGKSSVPPARPREAETDVACWGEETAPLGWPSATALARPAAIAHTPRHVQAPPARHAPGGRRGARIPMGGAGGPPLPTPPPAPRTTPPTAVARGGRWEQETTPPLGLGHLRQPGALQGHHGGPGATRSARPGGEQRGVGTALPMAGRAAHHTKPRKASESVRCVRGPRSHGHQEAERGRAGSGRSPHPPRALPAPPQQAEEEEEHEGPAGRTRRAVPFAMNVRPSSDAA